MHHARYSLVWLLLVLGVGSFAACLGRLPDLSNTGQQPNVQVITAAPTDTAALGTPTVDPKGLTLTAPPLPPPTFYTPNPLNAAGTPKTATPLPATLAPGQTLATMFPPTRHPGKAVDLSKGTPEPQIIISVRRANGDYDTYRIPTRLFENFTGEAQNQRFNQLMEVQPGDEIFGWQWPSNNGPASPLPTPLSGSGEANVGPTPTLMPTPAKIVNLAAGVPPTATMLYMIKRADGTIEKYLVPTKLLPTDKTYPQVRDKVLNMGPKDILLDASPLESPPMLPESAKPTP